jgi:hypothetical protein
METEVLLPYKQKLNEAFEKVEQFQHLGTTTVILQVVVYRCETWSLTLREKYRPRTFENMVLRGGIWDKERLGKSGVDKTT